MELKEMIEVMQHFEKGGEVEYSQRGTNKWKEANSPTWNWREYDYRIKPKQELVPFSFDDDLLGKEIEHKKEDFRGIITAQNQNGLNIGTCKFIAYGDLLEYYIFKEDGSPCGKIV